MKITLNLMKNKPTVTVKGAAEADAIRMMERGLVAYYTVQKVLNDCQNDHEQSEEFNNGVKKCLELINACDQAIIQNPDYEQRSLKYVDNQ